MSFIRSYDQVKERAESVTQRLRLPEPAKPVVERTFPAKIADLSDEEVAEQFAHWSGLCSYTRYQLSIMESVAAYAEQEADNDFNIRFAHSTEATMTERRHNVGATKANVALRRAAAENRADARTVAALLYSYEQYANVMGRELTRRSREQR